MFLLCLPYDLSSSANANPPPCLPSDWQNSDKIRYLFAPWHFWKAGRNAVQILIFTLVAEALGECCPNFGTLALFKRRENAAQILIFILWLGHSLEHPKGAKLTSKSTQNRPQTYKNAKVAAKSNRKTILEAVKTDFKPQDSDFGGQEGDFGGQNERDHQNVLTFGRGRWNGGGL